MKDISINIEEKKDVDAGRVFCPQILGTNVYIPKSVYANLENSHDNIYKRLTTGNTTLVGQDTRL